MNAVYCGPPAYFECPSFCDNRHCNSTVPIAVLFFNPDSVTPTSLHGALGIPVLVASDPAPEKGVFSVLGLDEGNLTRIVLLVVIEVLRFGKPDQGLCLFESHVSIGGNNAYFEGVHV